MNGVVNARGMLPLFNSILHHYTIIIFERKNSIAIKSVVIKIDKKKTDKNVFRRDRTIS